MSIPRHLLLLLALVVSACAPQDDAAGTSQLEQLRGQWIVINYWATWCKPCIKEIPELNALAERYPQVAVMGVNFDGARGEELARQVGQLNIRFPVLEEDPAPMLGTPRPVVLPTTLVIDPQGRLLDPLVGPQTLASLAAATGQKKPAQEAGITGVPTEG